MILISNVLPRVARLFFRLAMAGAPFLSAPADKGGAFGRSAGFLTLHSLFPPADSDPSFLRALCGGHGRKTRTLHENREECGTRSWADRPHRGINLVATFLRRKQEKRTICEPGIQIGNSGSVQRGGAA